MSSFYTCRRKSWANHDNFLSQYFKPFGNLRIILIFSPSEDCGKVNFRADVVTAFPNLTNVLTELTTLAGFSLNMTTGYTTIAIPYNITRNLTANNASNNITTNSSMSINLVNYTYRTIPDVLTLNITFVETQLRFYSGKSKNISQNGYAIFKNDRRCL